jgi:hypothetical protein
MYFRKVCQTDDTVYGLLPCLDIIPDFDSFQVSHILYYYKDI